jgi:hypothetical protein
MLLTDLAASRFFFPKPPGNPPKPGTPIGLLILVLTDPGK